MNIRIAIVDDLDQDRAKLAHYLEKYKKEKDLEIAIDMFASGTDFLESFNKGLYTLVFLDIFMDGENGIGVAHKIRETDNQVTLVFTTITPNFALEGSGVRAYDYILKPLPYQAVEKVLSETFYKNNLLLPYIEVKENRCRVKILVDDILYVDTDNHYLLIHTAHRTVRTYMRFRDFYPMLENYEQFLCCYRNIVINMNHVKEMKDKDFVMSNDDHIPIKRNAKQELRQKYTDFMFFKTTDNVICSPEQPAKK